MRYIIYSIILTLVARCAPYKGYGAFIILWQTIYTVSINYESLFQFGPYYYSNPYNHHFVIPGSICYKYFLTIIYIRSVLYPFVFRHIYVCFISYLTFFRYPFVFFLLEKKLPKKIKTQKL